MHILLYYGCPVTLLSCCFYGMIEEKYSKYKLKAINDDIIEIDNCDIIFDSVRTTSLVHNNRDNNVVIPLTPLDNIIL